MPLGFWEPVLRGHLRLPWSQHTTSLNIPNFGGKTFFSVIYFIRFFSVTLTLAWFARLVFGWNSFKSRLYPIMYFLACFLGRNVPYMCIYIWWTFYMGYNFPVPFGNVPCSIIGSVVTYVATWLGFKSEFRSQPAFRQKFKSFLLFQTVVITIGFHGFFINAAFEKLTTYQSKHGIQLQWTVLAITKMDSVDSKYLLLSYCT